MLVLKDGKAYLKGRDKKLKLIASNKLNQYLFEPIEIQKKFTVKDLFLLIKKNESILNLVSRFDGKIFIEETLKRRSRGCISKSSKIEFYWRIEFNDRKIEGLDFPCVHGINGRGNAFGLDFLPGSDFKHCALKIDPSFRLLGHENLEQATKTPTFGQIIYSLIWEMSYWGNPKKRDQQAPVSKEEEEYIEGNPEPTQSIEELFNSLRRRRR